MNGSVWSLGTPVSIFNELIVRLVSDDKREGGNDLIIFYADITVTILDIQFEIFESRIICIPLRWVSGCVHELAGGVKNI